MKYGFVYIWYDRKRKMFYIGCHWGSVDDGYVCSSNRMRDAYRRRPQDFKRRILITNLPSREQTFDEEHKWFSFIKEEELGVKYYNLRKHKWGHWASDVYSKLSVSEKVSKALRGRKQPLELVEKRKQTCKEMGITFDWNKGRKYSEEEHYKRSLTRKPAWNKGLTADDPTVSQYGKKSGESRKGKKMPSVSRKNSIKIVCPNCDAVGGATVMKRWHFDNCKMKM